MMDITDTAMAIRYRHRLRDIVRHHPMGIITARRLPRRHGDITTMLRHRHRLAPPLHHHHMAVRGQRSAGQALQGRAPQEAYRPQDLHRAALATHRAVPEDKNLKVFGSPKKIRGIFFIN